MLKTCFTWLFGSTYTCESEFNTLLLIKNYHRSRSTKRITRKRSGRKNVWTKRVWRTRGFRKIFGVREVVGRVWRLRWQSEGAVCKRK